MLAALLAPPGRARATPACSFQLGFAALAGALPRQVGACLDDERHDAGSGDALQHTIGGLLVWRKADNWTAFTDGYRTWVAGPDGVQERLNTQRFAWEADPDGLPVAGAITAPAGVVALGGGVERADYPTLRLRVVYPAATVAAAGLGEFVTNWQAADAVVRARLGVATSAPMTVELRADGAAAPLGPGVRGFSAPGQGRMYQLYDGSGDPGDRADITAHELGHMRMYLRDGEGANPMLREGVAMYASEPFLQRDGLVTLHDFAQAAYQEHRLVSLATLSTPDAAFDGRLLDRLDYDLAGSFVA